MTEISTKADAYFARYAYPDWLREHSLLVGRIGETLCGAHLRRAELEAEAVILAAYLHDIGRSPLVAGDGREHNELSALILAAEGLSACAELARRHPVYTVLDPASAPRSLAEKIVYVADRRGGLAVQSIEERARDTAARHPRFAAEIERAIPIVRRIEREVFADMPFAPDELEAKLS